MRPLAVHHVSINVDDVDAADRFYTDVLGLRRRTDRPDFALLLTDTAETKAARMTTAVCDAVGLPLLRLGSTFAQGLRCSHSCLTVMSASAQRLICWRVLPLWPFPSRVGILRRPSLDYSARGSCMPR